MEWHAIGWMLCPEGVCVADYRIEGAHREYPLDCGLRDRVGERYLAVPERGHAGWVTRPPPIFLLLLTVPPSF
jgi:hypothetical protein